MAWPRRMARVGSSDWKRLAEREGFEPPIPVKVCPLSRRIVSTAHAPLRAGRTELWVFSRIHQQCGIAADQADLADCFA